VADADEDLSGHEAEIDAGGATGDDTDAGRTVQLPTPEAAPTPGTVLLRQPGMWGDC